MLVATVYLMLSRREFDRGYSYLADATPDLKRGTLVAVPFGKADRPIFGVVTELCETNAPPENLKSILFAFAEPYALTSKIVDLCLYFRSQLLCTFGELAKAALPVGLSMKTEALLRACAAPPDPLPILSESAARLWEALAVSGELSLDAPDLRAADELIRKGLAEKIYDPYTHTNEKKTPVFTAVKPPEQLRDDDFKKLPAKSAARYRAVLRDLWDLPGHSCTKSDLTGRFSLTDANLNTLEKRALIRKTELSGYRSPYSFGAAAQTDPDAARFDLPLNAEQKQAFAKLDSLAGSGQGAAALLYGVTGSGKTRVLFHLIRKLRDMQKGVLFLVPEIGLTSRAARELMQLFPDDVTVIHSGLSEGERHDAWVALKTGQKHIALGTRSAIFAPVNDLGLIVIDEEQDQSYCADNPPRFHARDLARFRAAHENALLVLSSATPDVETFYKAKTGKYTLCRLSSRAAAQNLPDVTIVDLKPDLKENPDFLIGKDLHAALAETLNKGEQAILFMNRRGYQFAPFCASCGQALICPSCSVALTLHRSRQNALCCHYCGYRIPLPDTCPHCGAKHLFFRGYGTQKLEEELRERFPDARILRMDADSVGAKLSRDRFLSEFASGGADILLGTQMVTKGHDFANVTLVGVVMADTSLYLGDYRASEETFSLLTQVIGRAGRGAKPGRAIVQTLNPDHEIFPLAATQDYDRFYAGEIALRKAVLYPPFCCLSAFTLSSQDEKLLHQAAQKFDAVFSEKMRADPAIKLIAYGPIEPMIAKLQNRYRLKFVIKHQNDARTRKLFYELIRFDRALIESGVRVVFELTPNQL